MITLIAQDCCGDNLLGRKVPLHRAHCRHSPPVCSVSGRRGALISRASHSAPAVWRLCDSCHCAHPQGPGTSQRGGSPQPWVRSSLPPTPTPGWPETRPVAQAAVNQDASAAAPGASRPLSCPVGILTTPPTRCHGSNPQRQPGQARAEEEGSVPLIQSASISVDVRVPE